MFKKKKIKNRHDFDKYKNLVDKHIDDKEEYQHYKELYEKIKNKYKQKILVNEISIDEERARLKSKLGMYDGRTVNVGLSIIILAISILANGMIQAYSISDYKYKFLAIILLTFSLYIILLRLINKDLYNDKEFVGGICLQVLEDIEREMLKEKNKLDNEKEIELFAKMIAQNIKDNPNNRIQTKEVITALQETAVSSINKATEITKVISGFIKNRKG